MKKTYVIDTNVFLNDPYCIEILRNGNENDIIIPNTVMCELDKLKSDMRVAHLVSRAVSEIEKHKDHITILKSDKDNRIKDEQILDELEKNDLLNKHPIIITNDKIFKLIATKKDINCECYENSIPFQSDSQRFSGFLEYNKNGEIDNPENISNFFVWENGFPTFHNNGEKKVINYINETWKVKPKCVNNNYDVYQNLALELLLNDDIPLVSIQGEAGYGKAQPWFSNILTPTGWKFMNDILIGDTVCTPDGMNAKVLQIHPQGSIKVWIVKFSDGTQTLCCENHLWKVKTGDEWSVKPLKELIELKNNNCEIQVPISNPINLNYVSVDVDPYVVGEEAVLKNDIIPNEYLFNSLLNRMRLLNGVIASLIKIPNSSITLNEYNNSSVISINSDRYKVDNSIKFLIQSLGGIFLDNKKLLKKFNLVNTTERVITLIFPSKFLNIENSKKFTYINENIKIEKSIEEIVYFDEVYSKCITINSKDQLYITDNCIVTHNSFLTLAAALYKVLERKTYKKIIFIKPTVEIGQKLGFLPGPQPLYSKLLTPTGWKRMGDIKVGDHVVCRKGTPTEVKEIFPQGKKLVYEITTDENARTHCCEDHLWLTKTLDEETGSVKTTKQIMDSLYKDGKINHYIPRNNYVDFTGNLNSDFPYYPYNFGAMVAEYKVSSIPNEYKFCSVLDRISLLQGFLDHIEHTTDLDHECELKIKSGQIANDIIEVIRSLGGIAHFKQDSINLDGYDVFIGIKDITDVFNDLNARYKDDINFSVGIKNIVPIDEQEVQCISIKDSENLYITDDYIVTHNTLDEKMDPYLEYVTDLLIKLDKERDTNKLFEDANNTKLNPRVFLFKPIGFLRGANIDNAFVIVDEAQLTSRHEMKAILTRMGENVKCVLLGDTSQVDNPISSHVNEHNNGLNWVVKKMKPSSCYAHMILKGYSSRGRITDEVLKSGI